MPYADPILPVLEHAVLTLQPEASHGWHTHQQGSLQACPPPAETSYLLFDSWVHAEGRAVGFYAKPLTWVNGQYFNWAVCLLHTCDSVGLSAEPPPVSVQYAQTRILTTAEPLAPTGLRPHWQAEDSGISGFGTLHWIRLPDGEPTVPSHRSSLQTEASTGIPMLAE